MIKLYTIIIMLFGSFGGSAQNAHQQVIADNYDELEFHFDFSYTPKIIRKWHAYYLIKRSLYDADKHELLMLALLKNYFYKKYPSGTDELFIADVMVNHRKAKTIHAHFNKLLQEERFMALSKALPFLKEEYLLLIMEQLMRRNKSLISLNGL